MTEQAMVDHVAKLAKPRLMELLKANVRHIYETTPGSANCKLVVEGSEVRFKLLTAKQPYRDIARFMAEDKLAGFILTPGLVPIVKAISADIRGRKLLVTRKIQGREDDKGVVAHLDDFGIRILMHSDPGSEETELIWECLYAVA
jgi:hypothetical protein